MEHRTENIFDLYKLLDQTDINLLLQVLRRYPWLWCMDRPVKQRPPLYIVNLQWTPKDAAATLKLNGRCDFVMSEVLRYFLFELF